MMFASRWLCTAYQAITFASESLLSGLADDRITPATNVSAASTPATGVQRSRRSCRITPPLHNGTDRVPPTGINLYRRADNTGDSRQHTDRTRSIKAPRLQALP